MLYLADTTMLFAGQVNCIWFGSISGGDMATTPSLIIISQVERLEQVTADGQRHILEVAERIG